MSTLNRRTFLKHSSLATGALAMGAPTLSPNAPPPKTTYAANDQIGIGVIGMGIIASYKLPTALEVPGTRLVAVADCYDGRLTRTKEVYGNDIFTTRDHQEVLARDDVDAVLICTPDHWHAQIAIDAMRAGKEVFVEKPMVQQLADGLQMVEVSGDTGRIVQVGSQSFRAPAHRKAKELIQAGAIGQVNMVEVQVSRNSAIGAWQYSIAPDASPETIDWDRFVGPAPKRPFDADRFFRWRKYWDYGTGVAGDLFVHSFSALHFMLDALGPTRCMATGGVYYWTEKREAPDIISALYDYPATAQHPAFTAITKCNFADGGGRGGFRFTGDEGILEINGRTVTVTKNPRSTPSVEGLVRGYNSVRTFSQAQQEAFEAAYRAEHPESPMYDDMAFGGTSEYSGPQGYNSNLEHFTNFFNAVRKEGEIVQDAAYGLRAAGAAILANLSYQAQGPVTWDPQAMRVVA